VEMLVILTFIIKQKFNCHAASRCLSTATTEQHHNEQPHYVLKTRLELCGNPEILYYTDSGNKPCRPNVLVLLSSQSDLIFCAHESDKMRVALYHLN